MKSWETLKGLDAVVHNPPNSTIFWEFYHPLLSGPRSCSRSCAKQTGVDNPLPEGLIREWNDLVADLSEGGPISIPRSYFHHVDGSPVLTRASSGFC